MSTVQSDEGLRRYNRRNQPLDVCHDGCHQGLAEQHDIEIVTLGCEVLLVESIPGVPPPDGRSGYDRAGPQVLERRLVAEKLLPSPLSAGKVDGEPLSGGESSSEHHVLANGLAALQPAYYY